MTLDKINYLNIGLMIVSLIAAFILPFEVFLFSYAFLGPAHYLTEISWLHDRQYFSPRKIDVVPLLVFSVLILLGSSYMLEGYQWEGIGKYYVEMTFLAFGVALVFVAVKHWGARAFFLLVLFAFTAAAHKAGPFKTIFGVYLPTLIHVYIFTGAFILFGALKSKSTSGYISFVVFLLCPILCFIVLPDMQYQPTPWGYETYLATFADLNRDLTVDVLGNNPFNMDFIAAAYPDSIYQMIAENPSGLLTLDSIPPALFNPETVNAGIIPAISSDPNKIIFLDQSYILVGRFIAFAYTYHYLNWFSKTSVIKWHEVPKWRFFLVVALWLTSIGLYFADYNLGFRWLFFLSFAHVLLEFPLNHQSFIGIGKEIGARLGGSPPPAKAVKATARK